MNIYIHLYTFVVPIDKRGIGIYYNEKIHASVGLQQFIRLGYEVEEIQRNVNITTIPMGFSVNMHDFELLFDAKAGIKYAIIEK